MLVTKIERNVFRGPRQNVGLDGFFLPKNNAKWAACQYFCEARGYKFMVLTEIGMSKIKKEIKNQNN